MSKQLKTPKELKKEFIIHAKAYLNGIEGYQKQCSHEDVSGWIDICDEHCHYNPTGYSIKLCNKCGKTLQVINHNQPIIEADGFKEFLMNRWKHLKIDLFELIKEEEI